MPRFNSLKMFQCFLILMSSLLMIKVVNLNLKHNSASHLPQSFKFVGLEDKINFCDKIKNHSVQVDYYSELTKGFLNKKLGFDVEPNSDLLKLENPYAEPSGGPGCKGLIIQDASLYNGKYYIYYGFPPVTFIYLPVHALLKFIPTDAFVLSFLSFFYIAMITFLGLKLANKDKILSSIFYFGFLFNPIWLYAMNFVVSAGVSRLFCAVNMILVYLLILMNTNKKFSFINLNLIFLFLTFAAITRPTYVPEFLILSSYLVVTNYKNNLRALLSSISVSVILWVLNFYYNYLRFNDLFENGQKFILNGGDFLHNGSILHFPKYLFGIISNFLYRIYEYFFSFPSFSSDGKAALNFNTSSKILPGAYSEGVIGYFIFNPLLAVLATFIILNLKNTKNIHPLVYISAFLLFINFFTISLLQMTALQFVLEFIPRLMILTYIICLQINKNTFITLSNNYFKICIILLTFFSTIQSTITWRSF
jgi:hypothetical protein